MKRVFVGIKADANLAGEIVAWQKIQKSNKVRWTSKKNLHLTVVPPWCEKNIEDLKMRLERLDLNVSPFSISFNNILFGPTRRHPRLIWVRGFVHHELLPNLKRKIEGGLGFASEKREFKFHITLGRFKEKDFGVISKKVKTDKISWKMKVDSFHLFESSLSRHGAEYEVLGEFRL
jgi:2'-5' RNA ligase